MPEGAGKKIYQHSYVPVTPMNYNNNLPENMGPLVHWHDCYTGSQLLSTRISGPHHRRKFTSGTISMVKSS